MGVGAAGDDAVAFRGERFSKDLGVCDHLARVYLELRLHGFLEADCLRRDDVDQWTALHPRKHGLIDGRSQVSLCQNHASTWAAQRFVRGRSDNLRMRYR